MEKAKTRIKDVSAKTAEETAATVAAPAPQEAKRRPIRSFTVGDCSASVWPRDHVVKGQTRRFYSITFERSYRDGMGHFRYSRSFNPNDLGALMALCQQAGEYINTLQDDQPSPAQD